MTLRIGNGFCGSSQSLARLVIVYPAKMVQTFDELRAWFRHAMRLMVVVLMAGWKGDLTELADMAQDGQKRWRPKHVAILAESGVPG